MDLISGMDLVLRMDLILGMDPGLYWDLGLDLDLELDLVMDLVSPVSSSTRAASLPSALWIVLCLLTFAVCPLMCLESPTAEPIPVVPVPTLVGDVPRALIGGAYACDGLSGEFPELGDCRFWLEILSEDSCGSFHFSSKALAENEG